MTFLPRALLASLCLSLGLVGCVRSESDGKKSRVLDGRVAPRGQARSTPAAKPAPAALSEARKNEGPTASLNRAAASTSAALAPKLEAAREAASEAGATINVRSGELAARTDTTPAGGFRGPAGVPTESDESPTELTGTPTPSPESATPGSPEAPAEQAPDYAQQLQIALGSASGRTGGTVSVTLAGQDRPITLVQLDLAYDPAKLRITAIRSGPSATAAGKQVQFNHLAVPGRTRLMVVGFGNQSLANGGLALIDFEVLDGAQGQVSLSASQVIATNANAERLSGVVSAGLFTISP
jgi:hypothetical protein